MNDWFEAEQHVEKAYELYESGHWEEALRELRAALRVNPYQGEWHFNMGLTLDALGRYREAVESFRHALAYLGEDIEILNHLAVACQREGRLDEALTHLEQAERLDPSHEQAYCHRVGVYAQMGDHEKADLMFYMARQISDECPRCYLNLSESLLDRGEHDRAIWCLKQVHRLEPDNNEIYARLGEAHAMKGDLEQAYRDYMQQLRRDPGDIDTLLDVGNLLIDMNRPIEAAEKFRRVTEIEPINADAHHYLGELALQSGHLDAAQMALEFALKLAPDRQGSHQKLAMVNLRRGRPEEARKHLVKELSLRGQQDAKREDSSDEELGQLLLDAGMAVEAVAVFRALVGDACEDARLWHQLAVALFLSNQLHEGVRVCRRAVKLDEHYLVALHNLALACHQLGQFDRARYWVKRALEVDPADRRLRRLSTKLWSLQLKRRVRRLWPFGR